MKSLLLLLCLILAGCEDKQMIQERNLWQNRLWAAKKLNIGDMLPDTLKYNLASSTTDYEKWYVEGYWFTTKHGKIVSKWRYGQ